MNLNEAGSLVAGMMASSAAIATYRGARRATRAENKAEGVRREADLERAERDGWKTLIDTLNSQYKDVLYQLGVTQGKLNERDKHVDRLGAALREARDEQITLIERVGTLRAEVTRLGGSVDEINRVGKRGPTGGAGERGERGEQGDPGDRGAKGAKGDKGEEGGAVRE